MVFTTVGPTLIEPFTNTFVGVGRNRIINGEMLIDQANAGGSVTVNSSGPIYSVDQFMGFGTGSAGVYTMQQSTSTPPTGFINFTRITTTTNDASPASGTQYVVENRVEANNVRDFNLGTANAVTFTLSFWIRSSLTGTFSGGLLNAGATRSYIFTYSIPTANTWTQISLTITGDTSGTWNNSGNALGISIAWDLGSGSTFEGAANTWTTPGGYWRTTGATRVISTASATWDITGIQLEIGSVATNFEYRPFEMELALCQRYYEKSYSLTVAPGTSDQNSRLINTGGIDGSGNQYVTVHFAVQKRASPTLSTWTGAGVSGNWTYVRSGSSGSVSAGIDVVGTSNMSIYTGNSGATWVVQLIYGQWVADSRL